MVKKTHLKDTIFFLCSPSLGILDNWLPIIWKLKKKQKDYKFIIIFPRSNFINQINLSNILLILGSNVFDSIVFKSDSGLWLINDSLNKVKSTNNLNIFEWFLLRIIKKLNRFPIFSIFSNLMQLCYKEFSKFLNKKNLFDWNFVENRGLCILYDVYEESKHYNAELMKSFRELPKFSIQHGINISNGGLLENKINLKDLVYRKDIKAYLFSSLELNLYKYEYAIHQSCLEVVGVPRHSFDWIDFIKSNLPKNKNDIDSVLDDSIFIISRPSGTTYFPHDRKKKALENIKSLAWNDLKKNIVVKLHPKEQKDGIYEEVFGCDTYGHKWIYSDLHPFVLGEVSEFAISFFSGVVLDMLALGVPTIEYLDLRGIPEFDNYESLRDKSGNPVLSYRYLDLVLGASDYKELKFYASEIINNRDKIISKLLTRYNEIFPRINHINDKISKDIIRKVLRKY